MRDTDSVERVPHWLSNCLPGAVVQACRAQNIKNGGEREVWDCRFTADGADSAAVLTVFKPGALRSVNTSLPPDQAASKCALAMTELPVFNIPTPRVLGYATVGDQAALLCEKIERIDWEPDSRIEAAGILARIHNLQETSLTESLQELARISDPREHRTTGGQAPQPESRTLVHGDYFSTNILPVAGGLCIIDWETFGWGDPMWDLGFLVGADRNLPQDEIYSTIAEYERHAPVNQEHLLWHRRRWSDYWSKRGHGSPTPHNEELCRPGKRPIG